MDLEEKIKAKSIFKKSIWPYTDHYRGHELSIFKDGSVIIRSTSIEDFDHAVKYLNEAFAYIDKKVDKEKKMNMNSNPTAMYGVCVGTTSGTAYLTNNFYDECVQLAPCTVTTDCPKVSVQKGNNPMYVDNDKHIESSKINYLFDRASAAFYNKEHPLRKQFNLVDDDAPASSQELVDRFVTGKFTFKDASKKDTKGFFYRPLENIRWRDPAVKEDQAGFTAAWEAFTKVYQDTKDTIAIGTPAEGLAAVKALDAWTPAK